MESSKFVVDFLCQWDRKRIVHVYDIHRQVLHGSSLHIGMYHFDSLYKAVFFPSNGAQEE